MLLNVFTAIIVDSAYRFQQKWNLLQFEGFDVVGVQNIKLADVAVGSADVCGK